MDVDEVEPQRYKKKKYRGYKKGFTRKFKKFKE
jgi:hypothetical protein